MGTHRSRTCAPLAPRLLLLSAFVAASGCGKQAAAPAADPAAGIAALRKAETAHDPLAKGKAIAGLEAMGRDALPRVLPLLRDPEPAIRADGVEVLTAIGEPAIKPAFAMIGNFSKETDRRVADVLGNLAPKSVPFLLQELKNADPTHHLSAAWAFAFEPRLAKMGEPALPDLVQLMHSTHRRSR